MTNEIKKVKNDGFNITEIGNKKLKTGSNIFNNGDRKAIENLNVENFSDTLSNNIIKDGINISNNLVQDVNEQIVETDEFRSLMQEKKESDLNSKGILSDRQIKAIVDFAYSQEEKQVKYNDAIIADLDIADKQLTCNGLVFRAYEAAGINVPKGSWSQMAGGEITSTGDASDMMPGDIIVFDEAPGGDGRYARQDDPKLNYNDIVGRTGIAHHVALYLGDGKMMESSPKVGVRLLDVNHYGGYSYSVRYTKSVPEDTI